MNLRSTPESAVIKIGTDSITPKVIAALAAQVAQTRKHVDRLAIVSSGAVQFGRMDQGVKKRPDETVSDQKFFAAIGQPLLMAAYTREFKKQGISVAQALVTWDDFDSRSIRAQLEGVLNRCFDSKKPTIAILNENDVTADDELVRYTDNDHLTVDVAELIDADAALFLSRLNGVRRNIRDPRSRIKTVDYGDDSWLQWIKESKSKNGKGGMKTKGKYVRELTEQGRDAIIASARIRNVVPRVLIDGDDIGTHFLPKQLGKQP
ncbi:MAG: hypothetical protein AAB544_02100 [Patescibacteria group bacterium]